jgi:hypothetical protein
MDEFSSCSVQMLVGSAAGSDLAGEADIANPTPSVRAPIAALFSFAIRASNLPSGAGNPRLQPRLIALFRREIPAISAAKAGAASDPGLLLPGCPAT